MPSKKIAICNSHTNIDIFFVNSNVIRKKNEQRGHTLLSAICTISPLAYFSFAHINDILTSDTRNIVIEYCVCVVHIKTFC